MTSVEGYARGFVVRLLSALYLAALLVGAGSSSNAQTINQGQPAVGNNGATAFTSSPVVLDATQFTGTNFNDACDKINAAITALLVAPNKNGVVDARGFTGAQICQESMFPDTAAGSAPYPQIPTGKLLLGNAVFWVTTTQVQPTKFQVEGVGWPNPHAQPNGTIPPDANTIIRACPSISPPTVCQSKSLSGTPPIIWCWGAGTGYSTGGCNGGGLTGDIAFGSLTQYVTFDCFGLANCVDMQAYDIQEGSGCWHCAFHGWGNGGIGLQICDGTAAGGGGCQNSSFLDLDVGIQDTTPGNTCNTTVNGINTVPILVNSHGNPGPRFLKGVTVSAAKCSGTSTPTDSIRYSSEFGSLEDLLVEQGTTLGLHLGADGNVNSVAVLNVDAGPPIGNGSNPTCGAFSGTTAVWLDPLHTITNVALSAAAIVSNSAHAVNVLVDCKNKKHYAYDGGGHGVVQYLVNDAGAVALAAGNDNITAFGSGVQLGVNTVAATAAALDVTAGNVQQIACPSSGGLVTVTPTVPTVLPGTEITLIFIQGPNVSNFCSITYPSIMHGGTSASPAYNSVSTQKFIVSNNGTDLYAEGAASVCTSSCGAP
jgi:hypothetical protein